MAQGKQFGGSPNSGLVARSEKQRQAHCKALSLFVLGAMKNQLGTLRSRVVRLEDASTHKYEILDKAANVEKLLKELETAVRETSPGDYLP